MRLTRRIVDDLILKDLLVGACSRIKRIELQMKEEWVAGVSLSTLPLEWVMGVSLSTLPLMGSRST